MKPCKTKTVMLSLSCYEDGTALYTVQHGTFLLYHGPSLEEAIAASDKVMNLAICKGRNAARKTGAHSANALSVRRH